MTTNELSPGVFIIILNWNNATDTMECLASVQQLKYNNYFIVLVDNGSGDDSLAKIYSWAKGDINIASSFKVNANNATKAVSILPFSIGEVVSQKGLLPDSFKNISADQRLILIQSEENMGFAKGSNVGIKFALKNNADYVLLLNNDTTIETDALTNMVNLLIAEKQLGGTSAQVRYYSMPDKVCNCGGKLYWFGARKYFFADAPVNKTPDKGFKNISFINGCAAMFRSSVLKEAGLLSEKYFFGEEDFELSWRFRKKQIPLACNYDAIVYHKVSASVNNAFNKNRLGKTYIHYLNRFINMRDQMWMPGWLVWRLVYIIYIVILLRKKFKLRWNLLFQFVNLLLKNSMRLNEVNKQTFEQALQINFDF